MSFPLRVLWLLLLFGRGGVGCCLFRSPIYSSERWTCLEESTLNLKAVWLKFFLSSTLNSIFRSLSFTCFFSEEFTVNFYLKCRFFLFSISTFSPQKLNLIPAHHVYEEFCYFWATFNLNLFKKFNFKPHTTFVLLIQHKFH